MILKDYFKTKNKHRDIILDLSSEFSDIVTSKEKVFKTNNEFIYIGEKKYPIEDLVLNKIPITDDLIKSLEEELNVIKNKFVYAIKYKKDLLNKLDNKINILNSLINETISNKNNKVIDILNVINNSYSNILNLNTVYTDNVLLDNDNYLFFNGERTILSSDKINIKEISQNYKIEINIPRSYLSYIVFNNSLKTIDTFKVYFVDGSTQVKFVKEFNSENKIIELNNNCTKIIIEGIGATQICSDLKICVGKNKININRGIIVFDCDFSKVKISDKYLISSHKDIKIFTCKKNEFKNLPMSYNDFKLNYYLLEKLVDINKTTNVNLIDNYLILFIETNNSMLNKIKIYGVDE